MPLRYLVVIGLQSDVSNSLCIQYINHQPSTSKDSYVHTYPIALNQVFNVVTGAYSTSASLDGNGASHGYVAAITVAIKTISTTAVTLFRARSVEKQFLLIIGI